MNKNEHEFLWTEKYRPKLVADTILPARIKTVFEDIVKDGKIPHLLLSGTAGVGKTTTAMALCDEMEIDYMFLNSSKENGVDTLRVKIEGYASTISLTGGQKVIILDEADGLTPAAQNALRGVMEQFSQNCTFILTCNFKSKIIEAIHSRTFEVDFTLLPQEKPRMATAFYKRMAEILKEEKISFEDDALIQLTMKYFPDYRRTINALQSFARGGSITNDILSQLSDVRKLSDLIEALKKKDFTTMRKWVVTNMDIEPAKVYRKIYDSLYESFKKESIPQAVILIAKYQYQAAFVADQEVNLVACLTEIMVECEIK